MNVAWCCARPLSFAARSRKSYWSGCIQAAIVICQQIFEILALLIFLLKILLKSASKSSFFCFGVEIRFWSCYCRRCCAWFYCGLQLSLCRSHCNGCMNVAWCCAIPLSFAARSRKSYWSGCIQAAIVICQQIFEILALLIFLLKVFLKSASKSSFFCFGVEIRFWSCYCRRCCV